MPLTNGLGPDGKLTHMSTRWYHDTINYGPKETKTTKGVFVRVGFGWEHKTLTPTLDPKKAREIDIHLLHSPSVVLKLSL